MFDVFLNVLGVAGIVIVGSVTALFVFVIIKAIVKTVQEAKMSQQDKYYASLESSQRLMDDLKKYEERKNNVVK